MSRGVPDISEWIRFKKIETSSSADNTLDARKIRSTVPYRQVNPSLLKLRRLPPNKLVPLKIVAPNLLPNSNNNSGSPPSTPNSITFGAFGYQTLVASWSSVAEATSYTLRVYESLSSTVTTNSTVKYTFNSAVSGSTFNLVDYVEIGRYYAVGVTANNQYGSSSVRLSESKPTIPAGATSVTLTTPVSDGMFISWAAGQNATSYTVRIYEYLTVPENGLITVAGANRLMQTYTNATSGSKFLFTPVSPNFYSATVTSVNETGTDTADISASGYVRYVSGLNTADYNYQFREGNILPTSLYGFTGYDTGTANSWIIRLRKTDYDGDNVATALNTALTTAGTLLFTNVLNANQKLAFTYVTHITPENSNYFQITATKLPEPDSTVPFFAENTITKLTITEAAAPITEYVFSATSSINNNLIGVNPGSGNVLFVPVGNGPINIAISKTNKAGADVNSWITDNSTIGKTFRLRLVSDQSLLNFTASITGRTDRTTHWEINLATPSSQTPPAGQQPVGVTFPADVNIAFI